MCAVCVCGVCGVCVCVCVVCAWCVCGVCVVCVCVVCMCVLKVWTAVELEKIVRAWGLTLSVGKTKLLVAGALSSVEDLEAISSGRWRN